MEYDYVILLLFINMTTKLNKISDDYYVIEWLDRDGCGQIIASWEDGQWIIDSEMLGFETMIKIIKTLKDD